MAKYLLESSYGTPTSILTTELNSLASGSYSNASADQNNSTLDFFADFELNVTYGTGPTTGSIDLFIVTSIDASTFADGGGAVAPNVIMQAGSFGQPRNVTTAQKMHLRGVSLPPGHWKAIVFNNGTGQAFAASANTLKMGAYQTQA